MRFCVFMLALLGKLGWSFISPVLPFYLVLAKKSSGLHDRGCKSFYNTENNLLSMKTASMKLRVALALIVAICVTIPAPRLHAGNDQYAVVRILVLKRYNGKPLRNAAVVLHEVKKNGKQSNAGLELKTDSEGRTFYEGVPYGKLRIQVIAPGFRTFGKDYDISEPEHEVVIKMQRPTEQYSIYDDQDAQTQPEQDQPKKDKKQN